MNVQESVFSTQVDNVRAHYRSDEGCPWQLTILSFRYDWRIDGLFARATRSSVRSCQVRHNNEGGKEQDIEQHKKPSQDIWTSLSKTAFEHHSDESVS